MKYIGRLNTYSSRKYCNAVQYQNNQTNNTKVNLIKRESLMAFQESLPKIFNNVFSEQSFLKSSGIEDHLRKFSEYVSSGKKLCGALTLHTYQTLQNTKEVTQEAMYQAHVLAWATEMTQSYFLMSDEIQDEAKTRRGKTCWQLLPDVGIRAVNDLSLLRSSVYEMLKVTFQQEPSYQCIRHLFDKAFLYTEIGQHLDYTTSKIPDVNYDHFTMDLYYKIVYYKTQFYTTQLPILLGMVLSNRNVAESQKYVEDICIHMTRLLQMQDDYLDCFGNLDDIGKTRTDIQEGKCSWLAVTALERCTKAQRVVFKSCYGSREPAHIERIVRLYEQLQIPTIYKEKETALYNYIMQQTHDTHNRDKLPAEVFVNYLNIIYNRKS